jgi:hypothetical protein
MTPPSPHPRMSNVARVFPGQTLARLLLVFVLVCFVPRAALADSSQLPTTDSPVVYVNLTSGSLTMMTVDRPGIAIAADPGIDYRHVPASPNVDARIPAQVMLWSQTIHTPTGDLTLPAEPFVFPQLAGGPHDAIVVKGSGNVTLQMPATTALVVANVRRGSVQLNGYQNGIFVSHVGVGRVILNDVSGSGAVQVNSGPVIANASNFARLRVRTARGSMFFRDCSAQQIEATSLTGSILYDNGSFQPGLARFETVRGNVVLGISGGGVQIGAHSNAGKIYSGFGSDAQVSRSDDADSLATIGGGGPVVTATSQTGSVTFFPGSLRDHPELLQHVPPRMRSFTPPPQRMRSFTPPPQHLRRATPNAFRARTCAKPRCRP